MSVLNNEEKINFIKDNFHQYFDFTLNQNLSTTETVNLVIPLDKISSDNTSYDEDNYLVSDDFGNYHHDITFPENYKINDILSKYEDTDYEGVRGVCTNVVDGDTLDIKIPIKKEDGTISSIIKRVRLVGVNTPEANKTGYDVSKEFLEKVCFTPKYLKKLAWKREEIQLTEEEKTYYESVENDKPIYFKEDSIRPHGRNNKDFKRYYGILIVDGKNINEVILKEQLGELWYIPPSEFPSYEWTDYNTSVHVENFTNTFINVLYPYFNEEMTNVVFTPQDDYTKIYRYEIYKGVFYIKLQPYSNKIRMHLLPKYYDCSDSILFLKDDMTEPIIKKSNDYYHFAERSPINAYYLQNNEIRDRTTIPGNKKEYNLSDWTNTFCDFSYDTKEDTKGLDNIQICVGYRYNNSSPYYSLHYTGIRDNTNIQVEDRCTLIDANLDNIEEISNNITQYSYNTENNELYIQKPAVIRGTYDEPNTDHVTEVGPVYHKILKYINDLMYSEEYVPSENGWRKKYTQSKWVDITLADILLSSEKTIYNYSEVKDSGVKLNISINTGQQRKGLKLYINNTLCEIDPIDTDLSGNCSLILNNLKEPGSYDLKVVYDGEEYSEIESDIFNIKIEKTKATISLDAFPRTIIHENDPYPSIQGTSDLPKNTTIKFYLKDLLSITSYPFNPVEYEIGEIQLTKEDGTFSFSIDKALLPQTIFTDMSIHEITAISEETEIFLPTSSTIQIHYIPMGE